MMVLFVINININIYINIDNSGCDKKLYLNLTCGQIAFFAGKVDENVVSCPTTLSSTGNPLTVPLDVQQPIKGITA